MNTFGKTLISGAVGTTFMTAFSGLMSLLPKEEFFEPEQLSKMLKRIAPFLGKSTQQLAGWGAHTLVRVCFGSRSGKGQFFRSRPEPDKEKIFTENKTFHQTCEKPRTLATRKK